jgi:Acetyltransferase (GNAT) domain
VLREHPDHLLLDHLYVLPEAQSKGVGARAINEVLIISAKTQLPIRVGALKNSRSNRFYLKHGFTQVDISEWDVYYSRPASAPLVLDDVVEAIKQSWSASSSRRYSEQEPSLGQCAASALVLQDLIGGTILKQLVPEGMHFYNQIDSKAVDATGAQYIRGHDIISSHIASVADAQRACTDEQFFALRSAVVFHLKPR